MTLSIATFTLVDSIYFGSLKILLNGSEAITFDLLKAATYPTLWSKISIEVSELEDLYTALHVLKIQVIIGKTYEYHIQQHLI
jgi:hypothetical protein